MPSRSISKTIWKEIITFRKEMGQEHTQKNQEEDLIKQKFKIIPENPENREFGKREVCPGFFSQKISIIAQKTNQYLSVLPSRHMVEMSRKFFFSFTTI